MLKRVLNRHPYMLPHSEERCADTRAVTSGPSYNGLDVVERAS